MSAIFVNRQIKFIADNTGRPIEKQVSGKRINSAGDDASGPAVSEKMRTWINGLSQAEKNAGDGISFVRAAELFLHRFKDILLQDQRFKAFIETMSAKVNLIETGDLKRSISTVGNTDAMIDYVDTALTGLNRQRADHCTYYNNVKNAIRALTVNCDTMVAADWDTDMASALIEFKKNQILLQSSTSMLAQVN
jgi:flagellin-like hook-associated protein FlgL